MKRMCVAPLCIAVLVGRHAASAQENGSVKSDELARTSLNCKRENLIPCQPVARAGRAGDQELEFGVTPTFTHHSTEWDMDFLFKKPWTLAKRVEFMFGVGPEWIHIRENGITTNSVAGEVALDFMFWPSPKRRFGW